GPRKEAPPRIDLPPLRTLTPATPTAVAGVPSRPLPPARTGISGRVTDVKGSPVAGARVSLVANEDTAATTGADGAFAIPTVPPGKKLVLLAEGPAPLAARLVPGIAPGASGLVIVLRAASGSVSGHVIAKKDRAPLSGARVEASLGDWLARALTDERGSFGLPAPPGAITLVVSKEGFVPRTATAGTGPVEVELDAGTTLTGTVKRKGEPVAGAAVVARQSGVPLPFERRVVKTDDRGRFTFAGIPAAELKLFARSGALTSRLAAVRPDGAYDPEPLELELGEGATIVGRVSCDGAPVVGAKLTFDDLSATSEKDGTFSIAGVTPGLDVDLRAAAPGFATRSRVRVQPGRAVEVVLRRSSVLAITTSPPAEEISVQGADAERRLLQWGGVIDDLAPGLAWIVARTPGCAPVTRQVELKEGETLALDLELGLGASLEGTCLGEDGSPVVAASVVATDPDSGPLAASSAATSDGSGHFAIADLGPGRHHVTAAAPGWLEASADLDAGARTVSLTLSRSYTLEVQASVPHVEPDSHGHARRLGDLLVRVTSDKEPRRERVISGQSGSASAIFDGLRGQVYHVELLSPGLAPATDDVDPRSRPVATFTLAAGTEARGVVVAPDGTPLGGVAIARGSDPDEDLKSPGSFATLLAMTETDGTFDAEIDPRGETVTLTHPDYAPVTLSLSPGSGQKLVVAAGARITGHALTKDGRPQPDVGIAVEGPVSKRTRSLADGSFALKGLLPGSYRVKRADAPADPGVTVSVEAGSQTTIDLRGR
ncbi:MAG TPA: carboxypeptidase-like regulatory domain-containing protein, partial [Planctomycetota bacterium]|nr:carboxypeptidase-like regulatory domain-containing protein [Planctomycetota bacterium]